MTLQCNSFSVVERLRLFRTPFSFPFCGGGSNGGDRVGGSGMEEARIVGRWRNPEAVVGTVENANGIHENGIRIIEVVYTGFVEQCQLL